MSKIEISCKVNNNDVTLKVDHEKHLLDILREDLNLTGTKEGCEIGECGACTVVMNGKAVCSCLILAGQVDGKKILTVEGLEQKKIGQLLQKNFIEEGAVQCGFCTPGMLMSAYALLYNKQNPTEEEIKKSISGNLCRCTGYIPIINAIKTTVRDLKGNKVINNDEI